MVQGKSEKNFDGRNIREGEVYTSSDIMRILRIGDDTLTLWYNVGLEYTRVSLAPKAKRFVNGSNLIKFLDAYGMALRIISLMGNGEEEAEEDGSEEATG
jgi:hypothetical protein